MILPNINGKTYIQRLTSLYQIIYKKRFDETIIIPYLQFGIYFKHAFNKHGEIKLAACIVYHFEQNSPQIIEKKFPIFWIIKNIDKYLYEIREKYDVNVDDDAELYEAVKSRLEYLKIPFPM